MKSVISRKTKPSNPPVCVDSTAVGTGTHCIPIAEIIGSMTASEHLPNPDISCIAAQIGCLSVVIPHLRFYLTGGIRFCHCPAGQNSTVLRKFSLRYYNTFCA